AEVPAPVFEIPRNVICVGAVVVLDQKCLMIREKAGRLAGQWSIPWGFVEEREPPDAAAAREAREEAGVVIAVEGLIGVATLRNPPGSIGLVFRGRLDPQDQLPRADGVESSDARFFPLGEVTDESVPVEPWCRWVVQRVLEGRSVTIHKAE